jgi:ADP-ribosylation factor GTPase-activating protein 1
VSSTVSTTLQSGTKVASTTFHRFVEGDTPGQPRQAGASAGTRGGPEPDKVDFWDDFAATAEQRMAEKEQEKAKGPDSDKLDFWDDFAAAGEQRMAAKSKVAPERKDFWDEFSAIGGAKGAGAAASPAATAAQQEQAAKPKSSVGTAALSKRKPGKGEDEWGEW